MAAAAPTGGSPAYGTPPAGAAYPVMLRGETYHWSRSLGGAVLTPLIWLLLGGVVSTIVLGAAWSLAHRDMDREAFGAAARQFEYWEGMLSAHLQIALLIPLSMLAMRFLHETSAGFLWSVEGRPRWRFLAGSFGIAAAVFALYVLIIALTGEGLRWQPQQGLVPFVLVIVLVGPFQAAAEEIFFRGYLLQALGSLVATPWFGVVASALVFALFHGTQNLALFVSRFAFGVVVGWLVLRTGGIEAAIAAHVVNNTVAFLLAGLTSTISAARTTTAVGWTQSFSGVLTYVVFTLLAVALAVLMKVRRTVPSVDRSAARSRPGDLP